MRMPNPWIVVPVLVSAVAGGIVGYFITDASCAPGSCTGAAVAIASIVGIGTAIGVGVVVVLAAKSIAEWRLQGDREITMPAEEGPPTC